MTGTALLVAMEDVPVDGPSMLSLEELHRALVLLLPRLGCEKCRDCGGGRCVDRAFVNRGGIPGFELANHVVLMPAPLDSSCQFRQLYGGVCG